MCQYLAQAAVVGLGMHLLLSFVALVWAASILSGCAEPMPVLATYHPQVGHCGTETPPECDLAGPSAWQGATQTDELDHELMPDFDGSPANAPHGDEQLDDSVATADIRLASPQSADGQGKPQGLSEALAVQSADETIAGDDPKGPAADLSPPSTVRPRINLNTASVEELRTLPGIGPALAERIVAYRERRPFRSTSQIRRVKGIGSARFEKLQELIEVGPSAVRKP